MVSGRPIRAWFLIFAFVRRVPAAKLRPLKSRRVRDLVDEDQDLQLEQQLLSLLRTSPAKVSGFEFQFCEPKMRETVLQIG